MLGAEREHAGLGLAIEERIRVLNPAEAAGGNRLPELRAVDVREAVGTELPLAAELLEDACSLGDRHLRIPCMREVHRDALHPKPAEARLELTPDARRRETVVGAGRHRIERLRREDELLGDTGPLRAKPLSDPGLAPAAAVGVRSVEGGDPRLPGGVHDRKRLVAGLALAEERGRRSDAAEVAATEDDAGDANPGWA